MPANIGVVTAMPAPQGCGAGGVSRPYAVRPLLLVTSIVAESELAPGRLWNSTTPTTVDISLGLLVQSPRLSRASDDFRGFAQIKWMTVRRPGRESD